jgi:SpoVK/Ycf46/Vps4 family AAA+-type ATPase
LVIFVADSDKENLLDAAFLRRMGYRARVEMPTSSAYLEIFKRAASAKGIKLDQQSLEHVLARYRDEGRPMKACEPGDLLNCVKDLCLLERRSPRLTAELLDLAWKNYFGVAHSFESPTAKMLSAGQGQAIAI